MINKKIFGFLIIMLFLTTSFAGVYASEINSNDIKEKKLNPISVWITSAGYNADRFKIDVKVCGDSDDDDYGNLWIVYRKDEFDTWHYGSDEAASPGCVEESWSYSTTGQKTVSIKLRIGHMPYYESEVYTLKVDIKSRPKSDSLILQRLLFQQQWSFLFKIIDLLN